MSKHPEVVEEIEEEVEVQVAEDPLRISIGFEDGTNVKIVLAIPAQVEIIA
jgi:hypothetical protein